MKCFLVVLSIVAAAGSLAYGQAAASPTLTPQVVTRYAELVRGEQEIGAQQKLLTELADSHIKRAAEAQQGNKPEQATWETDLGRQLQEKATVIAASLAQTKKERVALEEAHRELSISLLANTPAEVTAGFSSSEMAYLDKLEEKSLKAEQEAAMLVETRRNYTQQVLTNTAAEDILRLNIMLQQTQNEVRELEFQKTFLELKKLEFRALRRVVTK
jgi:hypothetical protein